MSAIMARSTGRLTSWPMASTKCCATVALRSAYACVHAGPRASYSLHPHRARAAASHYMAFRTRL